MQLIKKAIQIRSLHVHHTPSMTLDTPLPCEWHSATSLVIGGSSAWHPLSVSTAHRVSSYLRDSSVLEELTLQCSVMAADTLRILLAGAAGCHSLRQLTIQGGLSSIQARVLSSSLGKFTIPSHPTVANHQGSQGYATPTGYPPAAGWVQCGGGAGTDADAVPTFAVQRSKALIRGRGFPVACGGRFEAQNTSNTPRHHCHVRSSVRDLDVAITPPFQPLHLILAPSTFPDLVATSVLEGVERSSRVVEVIVKSSVSSTSILTTLPKFRRRTQAVTRRNADAMDVYLKNHAACIRYLGEIRSPAEDETPLLRSPSPTAPCVLPHPPLSHPHDRGPARRMEGSVDVDDESHPFSRLPSWLANPMEQGAPPILVGGNPVAPVPKSAQPSATPSPSMARPPERPRFGEASWGVTNPHGDNKDLLTGCLAGVAFSNPVVASSTQQEAQLCGPTLSTGVSSHLNATPATAQPVPPQVPTEHCCIEKLEALVKLWISEQSCVLKELHASVHRLSEATQQQTCALQTCTNEMQRWAQMRCGCGLPPPPPPPPTAAAIDPHPVSKVTPVSFPFPPPPPPMPCAPPQSFIARPALRRIPVPTPPSSHQSIRQPLGAPSGRFKQVAPVHVPPKALS